MQTERRTGVRVNFSFSRPENFFVANFSSQRKTGRAYYCEHAIFVSITPPDSGKVILIIVIDRLSSCAASGGPPRTRQITNINGCLKAKFGHKDSDLEMMDNSYRLKAITLLLDNDDGEWIFYCNWKSNVCGPHTAPEKLTDARWCLSGQWVVSLVNWWAFAAKWRSFNNCAPVPVIRFPTKRMWID